MRFNAAYTRCYLSPVERHFTEWKMLKIETSTCLLQERNRLKYHLEGQHRAKYIPLACTWSQALLKAKKIKVLPRTCPCLTCVGGVADCATGYRTYKTFAWKSCHYDRFCSEYVWCLLRCIYNLHLFRNMLPVFLLLATVVSIHAG